MKEENSRRKGRAPRAGGDAGAGAETEAGRREGFQGAEAAEAGATEGVASEADAEAGDKSREISASYRRFDISPRARSVVGVFRCERTRFVESFSYHVRNARARLISSPPAPPRSVRPRARHTLNPYPDDPCDRIASFLVVTTRYRATAPSRYPSVHIVLSKNVHPRKKSDIFSDRFARPALLQP